MTETQKEIRQRILHAADHKAQLQSSQSFFSTNSIVNISLGVLVIFLTIAMFVVMHNKNNSRVMVTSPVQQKVDTSHLVSKAEVQSKLDVVDKKIDTIDQRLAVVFRKIWLLGLVTNENASIQRKAGNGRSEEHTSELQSHHDLVCRLL